VRAPEVDGVSGITSGALGAAADISPIPAGLAQDYSKCLLLAVSFRPQFKLFAAQIEEPATLSE
jgi:hypothetical protein